MKSYSTIAGVQDAMTQWWFGHNSVAFFLTSGFLGLLYYFLPKRVERPIYSYRLSTFEGSLMAIRTSTGCRITPTGRSGMSAQAQWAGSR